MELSEVLKQESYEVACEIIKKANTKPGDIFIVGCSTSEVMGDKIGTNSVPEIADALFSGIHRATQENDLYLAAQCCEHLNRALILEESAAEKYGYELVNVIPQPKAGGSFATAAYKQMEHPVAVEHIHAHLGLDIGDTFIGMHLKDVAVPLRISRKSIGSAHITCARTRPKFIGGIRAIYDENQL